ncbi:helicase-related protein [Aquisphaera insulae]|uniref:helicase-related protein n=1 Tax=Aquisphaera insulae TaxID=2712864 RepID=UPI0013ED7A81|nr:helicase-related protein [Aquisphaera insulae]
MPRIFDNIDQSLLPAIRETLALSDRADFCVGYFNLRGWRQIDERIDRWSGGPGHCCRLLVGMQKLPKEELQDALSVLGSDHAIDNQTAIHKKRQLADEFRKQLMVGVPNNQDEAGLRRLAGQLRAGKVVVKLYLRHRLHAKLYLLFRPDPITPRIGYLGSSNLTFAGLSQQGELNVDVVDQDASAKLAKWFDDRWEDRWCLDISKELLEIIDQSWARAEVLSPYHIYLKIAYHLSQEARAGLNEFRLPRDFADRLFEFQVAAVKIAAHHLNKRGGVLIGDVVGLGKTLMATAVARIFEDDHGLETLILSPKNLVPMWEDYRERFGLRGRVLSISRAIKELPEKMRRYRLVLIDESHNLRNRDGRRYRVIRDYIQRNESKVILLSATPYNKSYLDLASQLRLFLAEDADLGIRPETRIRELGETEFIRRHQCAPRTLAAFEKSEHADDWRELMRLYLVRRTRSFIQDNYAQTDPETQRKYLTFRDGRRSYFPIRRPRTIKFKYDDHDPDDQYARLYSTPVVDAINRLTLPRYGLGNYLHERPHDPPTAAEAKVIQDLSRAGKRLMGFCRTNLFKRLESSGRAFLQSVERHLLRNFVYLHAIDAGLPLPIGTQDATLLDSRFNDADWEIPDDEADEETSPDLADGPGCLCTEEQFRARAAQVYSEYAGRWPRRFRWLPAARFLPALARDLRGDATELLDVLARCGDWDPGRDAKLDRLAALLLKKHPGRKALVFTQFADTVAYLVAELRRRGVEDIAAVTGDSADPTELAHRFSPESNGKRASVPPARELDVLVATDVLSEGQNLQDASIVINYDLPWAIIRLIQRAGRVDRIGQNSAEILCYSFLPASGVERIIHLRARVRQRLRENAEVVGSDESFFEDDRNDDVIRDLFTEKAGILDGDSDTEVDLGSFAYQIWKNAIDRDPPLEKTIPDLPDVVYSTRPCTPGPDRPEGVLAYVRTAEGNDALAWLDTAGRVVTESQFAILRAAECTPETPAIARHDNHHSLVRRAVELIADEEKVAGGQLGRPSGARFRTYERLKNYADAVKGTLFDTQQLRRAIENIYNYPLRQLAVDILNRQLRHGISDEDLARRVVELQEEGRLCIILDEEESQEPRIICSMGLKATKEPVPPCP